MRYLFPIVASLLLPLSACTMHAATATVPAAVTQRPDDGGGQIVDKYVDASHTQQLALRGAQMQVDIDAKLVRLKKQGRLRALRSISKLGKITYRALGFSGDNTVKQEVISRYLAAESEGRENGSMAITPDNYKFKYKGAKDLSGRRIAVLQITPKKKALGLFKGELWVDAQTGMPMREAGEFVKSPSVFLKKIAFVRDYEMENGVAIPKHIESMVDTRVVGRAEIEISFSNFSRTEGDLDDAEASEAAAGNPTGVNAEPAAPTVGTQLNRAQPVSEVQPANGTQPVNAVQGNTTDAAPGGTQTPLAKPETVPGANAAENSAESSTVEKPTAEKTVDAAPAVENLQKPQNQGEPDFCH